MRRIIITLVIAVLAAVGLGTFAIATSSGSAITRPRLESSVQASFANVYSQEAALLGHNGVTPATMKPRTYCDKGPGIPQSGPGTSWNCLVSWHDPNVPMPSTGYGKLEVTVHSNGCYTVGSPSTMIGYQTLTDKFGKTVNNPAYEFDGCIDPDSPNTPHGVTFPPELKIASTTALVDGQRHASVDLTCGPGAGSCAGTFTATADGKSLGTVPYSMTETATGHLTFPVAVPAGAKTVTYTAHGSHEVLPSPTTLDIQG